MSCRLSSLSFVHYLVPSVLTGLIAVQLPAQEPDRVAVPDATRQVTSVPPASPVVPTGPILDVAENAPSLVPRGATMPPAPITVLPGEISPPRADLGDEPDYCPMEDVLDEHHNIVAIRRAGNPYVLSFTNGDYTPEPGVDPRLRRALLARPDGHTFGFVMFKGRMSAAKLAAVRATGVQLFDPMTYQSLQAKIPSRALPALEQLPFVHWIGYAREHQKLDRNLAPIVGAARDGDLLPVIVNPFAPDVGEGSETRVLGARTVHPEWITVDVEGAPSRVVIPNGRFHRRLVGGFGFEFGQYNEITHGFRGRMTKARLIELLREDWVHSVEVDPGVPQAFHDQAMPMAGQDWVRYSYGGSGVACGFADTGLDSTPWHDDFGGKSFVYFNNAITPTTGHGTHVAGTLWANGTADGRYRGAAPTAGTGGATNRLFLHLFVTGTQPPSNLSTIVSDFGRDFTDSRNNVSPYPRVMNGSWGWRSTAGFSGTEDTARTVDQACYDKRQLWVFACGNQGVANMWCATPASGKNVLAVGSVIDKFNAARTINPEQKSATSLWGVTDGRTKPELVACGDDLTSTLWNSRTGYSTGGGTSGAAPTVTGVLISKIDSNSWFNDKPEALRALAVASCENEGLLSGGVYQSPGSSAPAQQTTGWGMINAPGMVWALTETTHQTVGLTFTATGQGWYGDISVPSDAQFVRVVVATTEPPVASTASKARRNDVRAYLDWAPFTAGNNTGEIQVASGAQTVIVYNWASVPAASKGGTVRLKAYAQSIVASQARTAVVVFWYKRHPTTYPYVTATGGPDVVRPRGSYVLTAAMHSPSGGDQFRNGRLWVDGAFTMAAIKRVTLDGYTQFYPDASHPSLPYPSKGFGPDTGIVVGSGTYRAVEFQLAAPLTEGLHTLFLRGTYASPISPAPVVEAKTVVCVDASAPNTLGNLRCTSHTAGAWSNRTTMTHTWNTPTDVGCSGVMSLPFVVSTGSAAQPDENSPALPGTATSDSRPVSNHASGYYFNIRARDKAQNFSTTQSLGPYKIDTTLPVVNSVSINSGASKTPSLVVSVLATGSDTVSGVQYMQYSANGSSWTGNYQYTTLSRSLDMSALPGGNANEGGKYVYVRLSDHAGNYSVAKADQIEYLAPPVISGGRIDRLEAVTYGAYTLTGTGFNETTQVTFGTSTISAKYDTREQSWWPNGAFQVLSDTSLYVYPPQGRTPGTYGIRSFNGLSWSNVKNVFVSQNPAPILRTNSSLTAGSIHTIVVARGNLPSTVGQYALLASVARVPSKFLPFYDFEIGNRFSQLEIPLRLSFDAQGVSVLSYKTTAAFKGVTAYFEAAYLDFTKPVWPMPSSDVWSTSFK